jgi:redox-sensitive bicupin YhaK (pirin superfamily)
LDASETGKDEMSVTETSRAATAATLPRLKDVAELRHAPSGHWVGDGFPVRTIFAYDNARATSPFLLMDYAGPAMFPPSEKRRGVGEHPHRGFETVTIVYAGEVEHRDSGGGGGKIGPGDVQWMTAGSGVVHEEMHSQAYSRSGGRFEAVQLWVNLPARLKMTAPRYQTIRAGDIPEAALPNGAGRLRVIAGAYGAAKGPAATFTPMNLWEVRLESGKGATFEIALGHGAALFVLKGALTVNGKTRAKETDFVILERDGEGVRVDAGTDATVLVLSGEPIDEPVVGYGPFVMNTPDEIRRAIADYQAGRMGHLAPQR